MDDTLVRRLVVGVVGGVLSVAASVSAPGIPEQLPQQGGQASLAERAEELASGAGALPPSRNRTPVRPWAEGYDISWPQCPPGMGIPERPTLGKPLPPPGSLYAVIGLTNGPAFYPNPCLGQQVAYARAQHLWTSAYAVVTYPTSTQLREYGDRGPFPATSLGRLRNTGYAQAGINVGWMQGAGLPSPYLWLDVEPVRPPAPWSSDVQANRAVLDGAMRAYRDAGLRLGVYSTPYLWRSIVGDVRYGLPEWRAAGATSRERARAQCSAESIQGGDAVMGQWTNTEVDFNVLCPGRPPEEVLAEYFTPL